MAIKIGFNTLYWFITIVERMCDMILTIYKTTYLTRILVVSVSYFLELLRIFMAVL